MYRDKKFSDIFCQSKKTAYLCLSIVLYVRVCVIEIGICIYFLKGENKSTNKHSLTFLITILYEKNLQIVCGMRSYGCIAPVH